MDTKIKSTALIALAIGAFIFFSGILINAQEPEVHKTAQSSSTIEMKGVNICLECHDPSQTIGFHYPDIIEAIEKKKGQRRRICIDCHGRTGTDPDKPMTAPDQLEWIEDGNYYRVKEGTVHGIHLQKLNDEVLACETCHLIKDNDPTKLGDSLAIPEPDPGQILVCQICHLPSDPGNYISIHIISGHQECTTCHTGDLSVIHIRATSDLGQIE